MKRTRRCYDRDFKISIVAELEETGTRRIPMLRHFICRADPKTFLDCHILNAGIIGITEI